MSTRPSPLSLLVLSLALSPALSGQVAEWGLFKIQSDTQEVNDVAPTGPEGWVVDGFVETSNPGDFASMTLSGGGLAAPVPFTQDGNEWSVSLSYASLAAMDAAVPSGAAYVIQALGGTQGPINQSVTLPPANYPPVPHLVNSSFDALRFLDEQQLTTINWNNPGPQVAATGLVAFELEDRAPGGFEVEFMDFTGATSMNITANTVSANSCFDGQLAFGIIFPVPGAGGFGVDGNSGHGIITFFEAATFSRLAAAQVNVNPLNGMGQPANPQVFLPGPVGVIPGQTWQPSVDHTTFGVNAVLDVALVSVLPVNVPTPNGRLLVNPAGALTPVVLTSPGTPFQFPVQWNCSYFGATVRVQAGSVFPSGFIRLTNALDLMVGAF